MDNLYSFPMLIFFTIFSFLLSLVFIKWYSSNSTTTKNSPPSPPRFPILGNLHQLGLFPHRTFQALAHKYGPLMLLHMGNFPVLVVSSAEAASQVLKTHDLVFCDRKRRKIFDIMLYGSKDMASAAYGQYWRQVRSLGVLHLLSNKMVQSYRRVREEETQRMMQHIKEDSSSLPVNLTKLCSTVTNDIVCRVTLGKRYREEGEGWKFQKLLVEFGEVLGTIHVGDFIPWLDWLSKVNGFYGKAKRVAKHFDEFLDKVIEEHITRNEEEEEDVVVDSSTENQHDFVNVLLSLQKANDIGFPIDRITMKALIQDMFVAGTDSTSIILEWAMTEVLRNPLVMQKLQDEVRSVVGNNRTNKLVTEEDLNNMNYLKAVIKETLRLYSPFPLLVPRRCMRDVNLNGYDIEAGTVVMVNAWAIARDPSSWDQPQEFKPERFLNSSIDYKGLDFEYLPFGAGRRGCPGASFAVAANELVLANLVYQFDWKLPDGVAGEEELDMSESVGVFCRRKCPLLAIATPHM